MKYLLLGLLGWVSLSVIFAGMGLVFTIAGGSYNKYDIYETVQEGLLIATCLTIVGCVLGIVLPLVTTILK